MTLRPEVVRERLRKLREVVRNLASLRGLTQEEFASSFRHHWLAERGLHLAAETLLDVGNHILVAHCNVSPRDYEDVISKLAEQRIVTPGLAGHLRGLGGFRNVLVHGYLDLDLGRVQLALEEELGSFGEFAEEIESFLASVT